MTPARRAALLRLLDDWEAGRMTPWGNHSHAEWREYHDLRAEGLTACDREGLQTLTPAGLAAARREKDAAT